MSNDYISVGSSCKPATALTSTPEELRLDAGQSVEICTEKDYALICHNMGAAVSIWPKQNKSQDLIDSNNVVLLNSDQCIKLSSHRYSASSLVIIRFRPSIHLCLGICPGPRGKACPRSINETPYNMLSRNQLLIRGYKA